MKTLTPKGIYTPVFTTTLFTTAKKWEQPKCLSMYNAWIKKISHTHTHTQTGNHSTIKKEGNLAIWDSMDASGGYCAK